MERNFRIFIIAALVSLLSLSIFAEKKGGLQDAKINWLSFDKGLIALEADTSGKHMFVDITASWCGWCKKMEREAFSDSTVISMLNNNFIPVKVWGDSDNILDIEGYRISERKLAKSEFKVSGYPCFYFLTPDKTKVGPLRGYQKTDKLLKALDWVYTREYEKQTELQQDDKPQQSESK